MKKNNVNDINVITTDILEAILFNLAVIVVVETASAGRQTHDVVIVKAGSEENAYFLDRKAANRFRQWICDGQWKHHDRVEGGVMGWYCRTDTYQW